MSSRRRTHVQLFAARLAHILNASDAPASRVLLNYGLVYDEVIKLLARQPQIRDDVVGLPQFPEPGDPDEAAEVYFERVVNRPLGIQPGKTSSAVFDLLAALLRRGASNAAGTAEIVVGRTGGPAADGGEPLDRWMRHIQAEIAKRHGRQPGPEDAVDAQPYLRIGAVVIGLPVRLSIWDSILVSPPLIAPIRDRERFLSFCARVINAVETANRHYFELLNLGLYPPDWLDEVSVNQARAVGRLCRRAQAISGKPRYSDIPVADWRAAWEDEKVPRCASVEAFLESVLGRALTGPAPGRVAAVDGGMLADTAWSEDAEILDAAAFARMLDRCRENGVIDAYETGLMERLFEGETIETLRADPEFQRRVGKQGAKIDRFIAELTARLVDFAGAQSA